MKSYEYINPQSNFENINFISQSWLRRFPYPFLLYFVGMMLVYIYSLQVFFSYPSSLIGSFINSQASITFLILWPILLIYYFFNNVNKFIILSVGDFLGSFILYSLFFRNKNESKVFKESKLKFVD